MTTYFTGESTNTMTAEAMERAEADRECLLGEIERLTRERDEARAEVERLRKELLALCDRAIAAGESALSAMGGGR